MKDYPDQTRNLNPTAGARVAMVMFGKKYSTFRGGSMDFWDVLSIEDKRRCVLAVEAVRDHDKLGHS